MLSSRALRFASRISSPNAAAAISGRLLAEDINLCSNYEGAKWHDNSNRSLHMARFCCKKRQLETSFLIQSAGFASWKKKNSSASKVREVEDEFDPDEDIDDSPHQPRDDDQPRGPRVKVKFNWKKGLVTADSLNLLENLYQTHPQLIEFHENDLVQYLQKMSEFSIDVDKAAEMLLMHPRLINTSSGRVASTISALRSIGVPENLRQSILRRVPQLIDLPPKRLTTQFSFLKTYLTASESVDVLIKSVETFMESESSLKRKLEYLIKEMSHETKNIVTCKVLACSLKHIKTRHEFLIRAGFFKPIPYQKLIKTLEKDYKDKNKPRDKYFRPLELVCYKDEDFLKVCTNDLLTLNELAAFEELYEKELLKEEEEKYDDGESDDEDLDEDDGQDAVNIIEGCNSQGFFNDAEAKSCYF